MSSVAVLGQAFDGRDHGVSLFVTEGGLDDMGALEDGWDDGLTAANVTGAD